MRRAWRWRPAALLACILATFSSGSATAADPQDTPNSDARLYTALRDIHNEGARLFNAGEPGAAYYLFQGALQAVEPVLSQRPAVQKSIGAGLSRAKAQPSMRDRAWVLHEVIETVRKEIKPPGAHPTNEEPPMAPPPSAKPRLPVPAADKKPDDKATAKPPAKAAK